MQFAQDLPEFVQDFHEFMQDFQEFVQDVEQFVRELMSLHDSKMPDNLARIGSNLHEFNALQLL